MLTPLCEAKQRQESANTAKRREIRLAVVESSKYIVFQM